MNVTYKKLWKLMIDKGISAAELRRQTDLSSCTITKLRRDEPVTITALLRIATVLECDISDICEFYSIEQSEDNVSGSQMSSNFID